MNRSRLLLGVASVFAGTTALLLVLGAAFNLVLAVLAVPFGVAAAFLWYDATGRLAAHMRRRTRRRHRRREPRDGSGGRPADASEDTGRREARRILGVERGADQEAIRRAYRDRAKRLHPDASEGDKEAFKRVTAAYERLKE